MPGRSRSATAAASSGEELDFVYSDVGPVYEETLRDLARTLALDYTPPA